MRLSALYTVLLSAAFLCSCSADESRVIPRDKMSRIYAEMFVADQRIGQDRKARTMADTSYVYEPIFEKYGYTVDDYVASMAYYIKDADRYAKILRETSIILEQEIADLKREKAALAPLEEALVLMEKYRPEKVLYMTGIDNPAITYADSLEFYVDTAGGPQYFDARAWSDTAFFGPVMDVAADSLAVPADSTAIVADKEIEK